MGHMVMKCLKILIQGKAYPRKSQEKRAKTSIRRENKIELPKTCLVFSRFPQVIKLVINDFQIKKLVNWD